MLRSVLTLLLLSPAAAIAQDNTFSPHHVAKLKMVVSAVVSPDGSKVAYLLAVPRNLPKEKDGTSWVELHVVDLKGKSTPFITGQVNIDAIEWTPDGKNISFLAKRDKDDHRSLYQIPLQGGEARRILTHGADILSYSWSPKGDRVAFLAEEPVAKDRKTQQDQGFTQEIYEEDNARVRVWIATVGSSQPAKALDLKGSASELHWSPNEDRLVVALAPTPLIDDHLMFRKVTIVHISTGQTYDLKNPGKLDQVSWSPDGKLLAIITGQDKHDPAAGRLWVQTASVSGWVDVLPNFLGHVESIAWANKKTLIAQTSEGVHTFIHKIDIELEGDKVKIGDKKKLASGPTTVFSKLSIDDAGKVLTSIVNAPDHPSEVFKLDIRQPDVVVENIVPLTNSNPWLAKMQFATQEVVKHKAKDGLELEGILIRPLGEVKGQRYPLVMNVHGGPEAHVSNGWSTYYHTLGQVAAAKGIAFFLPNYRGSTGRGVEFSMLGQKAAAGKEFDDLIDAVDHLIGMGLVDAKKVGITGGSYGGYATAWGATKFSDRFAAGVMFVGISNSVSKVGTTDIPQEMLLVHHRQWLWDDWNYFLKSSPIYYLETAKTPLLILHGKNDPRVHPSQSLELYRHLKVRNQAPVRLVLYPGEGHGNRRAGSRYDYNLRLLQWMEHYLKGPGGNPPPYQLDYQLTPPAMTAVNMSWDRRQGGAESTGPWIGRGCPCCLRP